MAARLMLIEGTIQKSNEGVVHLLVSRVIDRTRMLDCLHDQGGEAAQGERGSNAPLPRPVRSNSHPRDVRVLPKSRDFH